MESRLVKMHRNKLELSGWVFLLLNPDEFKG